MKKLKFLYFSTLIFLTASNAFGNSIEGTLRSVGKKGQGLLFAALPIFILQIGYLYKRGKPEAKEKIESLIIGGICVATAFGWKYIFNR